MHSHANHTIHRDHTHHGWNNAFKPALRIAPGETVQFETKDASSGQLSKTSNGRGAKEARSCLRQQTAEAHGLSPPPACALLL